MGRITTSIEPSKLGSVRISEFSTKTPVTNEKLQNNIVSIPEESGDQSGEYRAF